MAYKISDECIACGTCIDECPVEAISEGDIYVIDPERPSVYIRNVTYIQEKAGKGVEILKEKLKEQI